jgi:hypothetical protein
MRSLCTSVGRIPDALRPPSTPHTMPMVNRRFDIWMPAYAATAFARSRARRQRRKQLTHIMFLVCDHFEPRHGIRREEQAMARVDTWRRDYAAFQERCRRAFGTAPLHSWFYPPHHGSEHLARLAEMAHGRLGEVELHYHHDGDTSQSLRRDLAASIAEYQSWGLLLESGDRPRTAFGFIHGDWALGNSCGGKYCGVNDELTILQELGCWGDLTMPSGNRCQTRKINSIYYGVGDPDRPKAHDRGPDARVGVTDPSGLFLMQGPLAINWRAPGHPRPENASLTSHNWGRPDRIPVWLDCNIHVQGRPDWLFVKLHTHGAIERDFDALFGDKAFELHRVLNEQYNDGKHFRLHYVTARQAFNIAKAAEDGKSGDPSAWRDYRIQPPATQYYCLDARHRLEHCTAERIVIADIGAPDLARLRTCVGPVREYGGALAHVDIDASSGLARIDTKSGDAEISLTVPGGLPAEAVTGAIVVARGGPQEPTLLRMRDGRQCQVRFPSIA